MANIDEINALKARRMRNQVEAVQRVTEDVVDTLRAGAQKHPNHGSSHAGSGAEQLQHFLGTRPPLHGSDHADGRPSERQRTRGDRGSCTQPARGGPSCGTALVRGLQDVSREVAERSQQRLQRNFDGLQALARCRLMSDFVEVQSSLLRDNMDRLSAGAVGVSPS